jgi:hypothetical protein
MREITIGSYNCLIGNQPQNVAAPHSLESMRLTIKNQSFIFLDHFLQWSSSPQNSWKLDVVSESSQRLEETSNLSWPCTTQVLALDV